MAALDQAAQFPDGRIEHEGVPHEQRPVVPLGCLDQMIALFNSLGERLLAQDVMPRFEKSKRQAVVR